MNGVVTTSSLISRMVFIGLIAATSTALAFGQNPPSNENLGRVERNYSPLRILHKPRAAYPTSESGTVCIQGAVRLKVAFLSTGEIGNIYPVTSMPYGATENAIDAARKIKFVPAVRDGKPVTTVQTVEYIFGIY